MSELSTSTRALLRFSPPISRILVTRPFQTRIELAPELWGASAFADGFVTRRPARQSERPDVAGALALVGRAAMCFATRSASLPVPAMSIDVNECRKSSPTK